MALICGSPDAQWLPNSQESNLANSEMSSQTTPTSVLLDNWSLECAATFVDLGLPEIRAQVTADHLEAMSAAVERGDLTLQDGHHETLSEVPVYLGALSNLINALILYDDVNFIESGFHRSWQRT